MKKHNIYKTTNLVNGRFYWGVHNSVDENDGYLGSGIVLGKAIEKYGEDSFRRKTMVTYESAADAYIWAVKGGWSHLDSQGKNNPMYGRSNPNGVAAMKAANTGSSPSEKTRIKIRESNKGLKRSEEAKQKMRETRADFSGKNNPNYGKHRAHSEETKQKMRIKASDGKNKGQNNPNSRTNRERRKNNV